MILAIVMTDRASLHSMITSQMMCRLLCSLKLWRKTNLCFLKVFLNWAIWNSYLKPSRKDSRKIEPPSTLASNSPIEWSCQMWNLGRGNPLFFLQILNPIAITFAQKWMHLLHSLKVSEFGCLMFCAESFEFDWWENMFWKSFSRGNIFQGRRHFAPNSIPWVKEVSAWKGVCRLESTRVPVNKIQK